MARFTAWRRGGTALDNGYSAAVHGAVARTSPDGAAGAIDCAWAAATAGHVASRAAVGTRYRAAAARALDVAGGRLVTGDVATAASAIKPAGALLIAFHEARAVAAAGATCAARACDIGAGSVVALTRAGAVTATAGRTTGPRSAPGCSSCAHGTPRANSPGSARAAGRGAAAGAALATRAAGARSAGSALARPTRAAGARLVVASATRNQDGTAGDEERHAKDRRRIELTRYFPHIDASFAKSPVVS